MPKSYSVKGKKIMPMPSFQYEQKANMSDTQRNEINSIYEDDQKNGVKIKVKPHGFGPSQALMEQKLKMYIEAGLVVDKNDDGEINKFSKQDRRALGKEFETIHKEKGYTTNFTNIADNTEFSYTWDEFSRFVEAAGYKFVEQKPATPKAPTTPDSAPVTAKKDEEAPATPEAKTPATSAEPSNAENLDTVILDDTTYTDENGNEIAHDTRAKLKINGKEQEYHSKTGFDTFGTLTPDPVGWKQYSMSDDAAPSGKKDATAPVSVPTTPAGDKGSATVPPITVPEAPKTETPTPAPKLEAPIGSLTTPVPEPTTSSDKLKNVKAPVGETPVVETPTEHAKTETPTSSPKLEVPTGSLTTPVAVPAASSDKLKNVKVPVTTPPETKTETTDNKGETPAAPEAKQGAQSASAEFEARFAKDPDLAGKNPQERSTVLGAKVNDIENQISRLKQPTVQIKKSLFGGQKTKVLATAEQNTEANKDKIASLENDLDSAQRDKVYADATAGKVSGSSSTSLVDKDGNTVAKYPQYTTVKYKDASGKEFYVARVATYNSTTHKNDMSYYTFDVQRVNDLKGLPERWQAVPDMKNQLTDGEEIR